MSGKGAGFNRPNMKFYSIENALQQPEKAIGLVIHGRSIPPLDQFLKLQNLQYLELDRTQLRELPPELAALQHLSVIKLTNNQLSKVPEICARLPQLKTLQLSNNQIRSIPDWLGNCQSLEQLDLSYNQIEELPQSFHQLGELRSLSLRGNQLKKLSPALLKWEQLRELDLRDNRFSKLPSLAFFSHLDRLQLSGNQLKQLPPGLEMLSKLTSLKAAGNKLKTIPHHLPPHLLEIDFSNNQLEEFPDILDQLPHLRRLQLSRNRLSTLPDSLQHCRSLHELDLDNNRFQIVPDFIGKLNRLGRLRAGKNQLTTTAGWLPGLSRLEVLHLQKNQLKELVLPTAPSRLRTLFLNGNALDVSLRSFLHLDHLEKIAGVRGSKGVIAFIRAARKMELSIEERYFYYDLMFGKTADRTDLSLLLKGCRFPLKAVKSACFRELFRLSPSFSSKELASGSKISFLGRSEFGRSELKQLAEEAGWNWVRELKEQPDILILGKAIAALDASSWSSWPIILSEQDWLQFLREKALLATQTDALDTDRLRRLLRSGEDINIRMALLLLKKNGVPASLWTDLYLCYFQLPTGSLKRGVGRLFSFYADPVLQSLLRIPFHLFPPQQLPKIISEKLANTELNPLPIIDYWQKRAE
jgi:Leucine-rich repeat (LRR) protein